jgi:cyanophycin synthetase
MNIFSFGHYNVMVDYGHNPGGFKAIKKFLEHYPSSVKVGIITAVGDRRDEDIVAIGHLSSEMFDEIIIRIDKDLRGRTAASIIQLLKEGIALGRPSIKPLIIPDEFEAITYCLNAAVAGSLITVFSEHANDTCQYVLEQQKLRKTTGIIGDHSVAHHG